MQHCRRRTVQIPVLERGAGLVGDFGIHRDRAHETALGIVLDDCVAHAVDDFAGFRHETHGLLLQLPGAAQCRPKLLLDAPRGFIGDEVEGPAADHLLAHIAQPPLDSVIDIEVATVLVDRGRHHGRLAKQPLVVVVPAHRALYTEFRNPCHDISLFTEFRKLENNPKSLITMPLPGWHESCTNNS